MILKGLFFLFGVLALVAGDTYLLEDQFGSEYLMIPIPLHRQRRQTSVDINKNPGGTQVTLGHKGTIFENDNHLVSGRGFVSKQFDPTGSTTLGGGLGYEHKPSFGQTSVDINKNPGGTQVTLGHKGTIFENDNHLVSGRGFVSKQFDPTGSTTLGGGLGYEHKSSGSGINLGASNTRGYGTDFSATGNANLWRSQDGNSRLDAYANYNRHYGGPWGTGRPNYEGGLQFTSRF